MYKISVTIIAGNEEENIADCLKSVLWADEIILVDSESTDNTVSIAKEFTDKIFINKWEGFAQQKKYAMDLAGNEWVLSIDADERISPELQNEIFLLTGNNIDGYYIPRQNFFLGKNITTCGWGNDFQLRLFKKSKTSLTDNLVHEGFIVNGKTSRLKNPIIHLTHTSIEKTISKINFYSTLEAKEKVGKKKVGIKEIILHPLAGFLRYYISMKGYKDGLHGLLVSFFHSLTKLQTYTKIWEMQNSRKHQNIQNL